MKIQFTDIIDMNKAKILQLQAQLNDIYKDYRNVCLSKKYYAERLEKTINHNFKYEIFLAVGTSSAVAGWTIWQEPGWNMLWILIGATTAISTIIKPIINFPAEIERLTTLVTKYNILQIDFETLCFDIKSKNCLDESLIDLYKSHREDFKALGAKEDSAPPLEVLRRLQNDVNKEIPAHTLWSPK